MCKLIFKRIGYSFTIILGVMLMTFLLFNVAGGDPAAPILGQNAKAEEIEELRTKLGSNLPIIYGTYVATESYDSLNIKNKNFSHNISGNNFEFLNANLLKLDDGELIFKQNFSPKKPLYLKFKAKGKFYVNDTLIENKILKTNMVELINIKNDQIVLKGSGDIAELQFQYRQLNPFNSQLAKLSSELISFSLEKPYIKFFNMGNSITTNEPIKKIIYNGVWASLALMLPIFIGEMIIGIALALFSIAVKDTIMDKFIVVISVMMMSISYLVIIIFFQWFFGYRCNLFPIWGYGDIKYLILPICAGIFYGLGSGVRFYRTVFANELHKEYLRTAEAKGCSKYTIYCKHLLKNALIPIIAQASATLPFLFTGSLLLETFFGIPGLGSASIDALNSSDLQLLKALVLFSAILFITINFISDSLYSVLDVRIRDKN